MSDNSALIDALASILEDAEHISEYELIVRLQKPPFAFFKEDAFSDPLLLFQCHFMLFHCLYQLQRRWRQEQFRDLIIESTRIVVQPFVPIGKGLTTPDKLKAYYLDWANFEKTDTADVEAMLTNFWSKMGRSPRVEHTQSELNRAKQLFELEGHYDSATLKQRYRSLLHRHHPDKGGDVAIAQQVEQAYCLLLSLLR